MAGGLVRSGRELHVCLTSDASSVEHDNTPSSFIGDLPETLTLEPGQHKFAIKVHAIGLCNKLRGGASAPCEYLSIHIDELEGQAAGQEILRTAGGFRFPVPGGSDYGFHRFKDTTWLPARFQSLSRLTISLSDLYGRPVELGGDYVTLIQLTIMATTVTEDQFTITCSSNHPTLHPSNDLNYFTSPLPAETDLGGYEVALQQVVFPRQLKMGTTVGELRIDRVRLRFDLQRYGTSLEFLHHVQGAIYRHAVLRGRIRLVLKMGDDDRVKEVILRRSHHLSPDGTNSPMRVRYNGAFLRACGWAEHEPPLETAQLGPSEEISFRGVPNLHSALPSPVVMLQCSIVQTNVLAGRHANLLQCIPLQTLTSQDRVTLYEPPILSYHTIKPAPVTNIVFSLSNPNGSNCHVESGNPEDALFITLTFRRRRNPRVNQQ